MCTFLDELIRANILIIKGITRNLVMSNTMMENSNNSFPNILLPPLAAKRSAGKEVENFNLASDIMGGDHPLCDHDLSKRILIFTFFSVIMFNMMKLIATLRVKVHDLQMKFIMVEFYNVIQKNKDVICFFSCKKMIFFFLKHTVTSGKRSEC